MRTQLISRSARAITAAAVLVWGVAGIPTRIGAQERWTPVPPGAPRTPAEAQGFTRTTSHDEMWRYLDALRETGSDVRLGSYGTSLEGRALPYAIFSRPSVAAPSDAHTLGRPIILLAANVHGGERTLREGLLILMRELATRGTEANDLLDQVTVLVAPQLNPDGSEASTFGERGNARKVDLNRDYVKLEQPSMAQFVGALLGPWRPHVLVDGHDGGSRPYNLNYQCPSLAAADPELTRICDEEIFPAIDATLASEGMRSWYYQVGDEQEWRTGGFQARIGRNYAGLINTIGILLEAPEQPLERGARAGYLGYLTVLRFVAHHPNRILASVGRARAETLALGSGPAGEVPVRMEYAAEEGLVSYTLVRDRSPQGLLDAPDTIEVRGARLIKRPVVTRARPRPWAYLLPREAEPAAAMLLRHGIDIEVLTAPAVLEVDAYTVADLRPERAYDHPEALVVEVDSVIRRTISFPAGTYLVPTAQGLGRLVAHMLEVETDDNVVYWNTMDPWLRPGPRTDAGEFLVPIYKLMAPTQLRSRLLPPAGRR